MTIPFERTVCACADDVFNCYLQPGYLGRGDAERIAGALGRTELDPDLFRRGVAVLGNAATGRRLEVATIVPAKRDGRCVFLDANDRCEIHAVAPFGCAYFDVHQTHAEADRRSLWMLQLIASDDDYRRVAISLAWKETPTRRCLIDEAQQ